MPATAFGTYEAVATVEVAGETRELCATPISFVPTVRVTGLVFIVLGLVSLLVALRRRTAAGNARWLVLPAVLGVVGFLAIPESDEFGTTFPCLAAAEMWGLSLSLALICRFRKRRRTVATMLVIILNTLLWMGAFVLAEGTQWWTYYILPCIFGTLISAVPSLLGLIAVRRRFSGRRLAAGLLIVWAVSVPATVAGIVLAMDMPLDLVLVPTLLGGLPYLIGFFVLAVRNPWCREGLIRTFGLNADEPQASS